MTATATTTTATTFRNAADAWDALVGDQTPAEFMRYAEGSPADAAREYIDEANGDIFDLDEDDAETAVRLLAEYIIEQACPLWDEYEAAGCFEWDTALALAAAGITPEMAGTRTDAGLGGYIGTVGYKVSNRDLPIGAIADALARTE